MENFKDDLDAAIAYTDPEKQLGGCGCDPSTNTICEGCFLQGVLKRAREEIRTLEDELKYARRCFSSHKEGPWIVYSPNGPMIRVCDTLADGLMCCSEAKGKLYERFSSDAARQICVIETLQEKNDRLEDEVKQLEEKWNRRNVTVSGSQSLTYDMRNLVPTKETPHEHIVNLQKKVQDQINDRIEKMEEAEDETD